MKSSNFRFYPILAALLLMVFFAACEKDEIKVVDPQPIPTATTTTATSPVAGRLASSGTQVQSSSSAGALEIECISIDYPFDFVIDSVSYTVNSHDDVEDLFNNVVTTTTVQFDFGYPLNVTLEDGSTVVVAGGAELSMLVSACVPGTGWGNGSFPAFFFDDQSCISISYPVTLEDVDGSTIQANNETEFVDLIAVNPNYTFVFPLNVVDTTGAIVAVSGEQELFDLLAECACPGTGTGHGGGSAELSLFLGEGCFSYGYPIDFIDFEGNVSTVNDENELSAALLNGDFFNFVYSFNVTLEADGSVVSIGDEEDFVDVLENCFGGILDEIHAVDFISKSLYDSCYIMVYPFDIDDFGTITTVNNASEAVAFITGGEGVIVFPIEVISNGQQLTLAEPSEYTDLAEDCNDPGLSSVPARIFLSVGIDATSCYELIYPVTITNPDRTTFTLANEAEVNTYLQGSPSELVVFPVDVIETSTGAILRLLGSNDYVALLDNC